jgi:predicted nucleotidyltransferase
MRTLKNAPFLPAEERQLLERCRQAVAEVDPAAELILYGSRARGEAQADSDYDLLIQIDGPATLKTEDLFRRRLYPIELETGAVLTVLVACRADLNSPLYAAMPLYRNIHREGLLL